MFKCDLRIIIQKVMADQLIMYEIAVGIFAYLIFSLFYIWNKYSKKRPRELDILKKTKINWMIEQGSKNYHNRF